MSALSSSTKRLSLRLVLLQLFGTAILLVAAALWLEIPDSHVWELVVSLLLGAAIVLGALGLYSTVIRQMRMASDSCAHWLGAALLAVWAIVLYLPSVFVALASPQVYQRASYWNSQLSPRMRVLFSYERLASLQLAGFDLVVWFVVPAFLLPFLLETVASGISGRVWRHGLRVLGQWRYWASCIAVGLVLHFAVLPLVDWQPAHSVRGEVVGVLLRLGLVYVAVVVLLTLLVAFTAQMLARGDRLRNAESEPVEHSVEPILSDE